MKAKKRRAIVRKNKREHGTHPKRTMKNIRKLDQTKRRLKSFNRELPDVTR